MEVGEGGGGGRLQSLSECWRRSTRDLVDVSVT